MIFDKKAKIVVCVIGAIILVIVLFVVLFNKSVSSIVLNKQYIEIYEQEQVELKVTINPTDASKEKIIWTSENPSIASVTSNGLVIGCSFGSTKIIAKTEDGKVSDTCVVVVLTKEIESFELNRKDLVLNPGEDGEIIPIIIPEGLENEKVTWISSDPSIATVDENGKIHGISNGIAVIKATVLEKEASCNIFVGKKIDSLKMETIDLELETGKSIELKVTITPEDAIEEKIIWESNDSTVLEVDENGKITGKSVGNAEVVAKTEYSNIKDICYVTVIRRKYEVKYVDLDQINIIKEGDTLGTLPVITKDGYKFLGWYTEKNGGTKVTSETKVTSDMTLYPHWQMSYCLPKDGRFNSYNKVAYSDTETFKFRIIEYGSYDIAQIWVADASTQLKQGLAFGNATGANIAEAILAQIPGDKSLVAVNASLFDEGTGVPNFGIVIHDGQVVRSQSGRGGCVGITRDNTLVECTGQSLDGLLKMGIVNNFSISNSLVASKGDGTKSVAHRTQICQVDKNNFVIVSSNNTTTGQAAKVLYGFSGNKCGIAFNLDGGGSRKLYFRTKGGGLVKRFGGGRAIPDMLYFTEQ